MVEIEDLRKAGLTKYEANAYVSLLKHGAQKGGEVAEKTEIPKTRVYDALKSLVDKGIASMIQKKPMKFSAIEPKKGLKPLFEKKINNLKYSETQALESLEDLEKKEKEEEIEEKVTQILGYEKMFSYAIESYKEVRDELLILSVGEEIPEKMKITLSKLVDRGVDVKFIATKYDEENKDVLKDFQEKIGWKMRHYPHPREYSLTVQDRERAMVNVRKPGKEEERVSIFFQIPGLSKALAEYFDSIWEKAERIDV